MFPPSGPSLPSFDSSSMLATGPFHSTAPIHWAISQTSKNPESSVIFLTPCRQRFAAAMSQFNDEWLLDNSGGGTISGISSRIQTLFVILCCCSSSSLRDCGRISYPPSLAHVVFLLSSLCAPEPGKDAPPVDKKMILDQAPVAVVIHDLSYYFLKDSDENARRYRTFKFISSLIS